MVGGNYPPGTSRRDLIRGGIIEPHAHECEFEPDDPRDGPIIEDGAAIFHLRCNYVEGRWGEGWSCEETKTYRFEYGELDTPDDERIDLPDITEWDEVPDDVAEQVIRIEEEFHAGNNDVEMYVDPDPDGGCVELTFEGYTLRFSAE